MDSMSSSSSFIKPFHHSWNSFIYLKSFEICRLFVTLSDSLFFDCKSIKVKNITPIAIIPVIPIIIGIVYRFHFTLIILFLNTTIGHTIELNIAATNRYVHSGLRIKFIKIISDTLICCITPGGIVLVNIKIWYVTRNNISNPTMDNVRITLALRDIKATIPTSDAIPTLPANPNNSCMDWEFCSHPVRFSAPYTSWFGLHHTKKPDWIIIKSTVQKHVIAIKIRRSVFIYLKVYWTRIV